MIVQRPLVLCLLFAVAACHHDNSGDFESECALTCSLPDGGVLQAGQTVACCGVHEFPTHPGEEGTACTVDWVLGHTRQLCQTPPTNWYVGGDAGYVSYVCPASAYQCNCAAPHTYPSWEGCD
jgi:hypothetical protein